MKNIFNNKKLVLASVLTSIFLFGCTGEKKPEDNILRCFQVFPIKGGQANYHLQSKIKVYFSKDSVFFDEVIFKVSTDSLDSPKPFSKSMYLISEGTLFKRYSGTDGDFFGKFLTTTDSSEVSYRQFSNRIPQSNINYHLIEKNETRKFLGEVKSNSVTLYKFLVTANQVDGVNRFEFYNEHFLLIKTTFLDSSSGLDSVVQLDKCL